MMQIKRGFVDVQEGQMHYRTCGSSDGSSLPLVMLHGGGGTSKFLEPLMQQLGRRGSLIAFDQLGNGDSSAPVPAQPDVAYFADSVMRALDGMQMQRFDLYGWHTGANLAIEMAVNHPGRIRKLILDGVPLRTDAENEEQLAHYAPVVPITDFGSQFLWAWHFARDRFLFTKYYQKKRTGQRDVEFPNAEELHDITMEVLKGIRTYHLAYHASFRYRKVERLKLISMPTLITAAATDPIFGHADRVVALIPGATKAPNQGTATEAAAKETAALFAAFLEQIKVE